MYKTKEAAIKHIRNGENFANKVFDLVRNDREVILEAVRKNGDALKYASIEGQGDREIVLEAIKTDGAGRSPSGMLQYASEGPRKDKEVVLAAVRCNGMELRFASDELRKDREVVLAAVRRSNYGHAIIFASEELRKDREVVLALPKMMIKQILFLMRKQGSDMGVAIEIIKNDGWSLYQNFNPTTSKEFDEIIGNGDPAEMLSDYLDGLDIAKKVMESPKPEGVKPTRKKGKI